MGVKLVYFFVVVVVFFPFSVQSVEQTNLEIA